MSEFDAKIFCQSLPTQPGVYRMFDAAGTIIYVGKARNLKNRVTSYFHASRQHTRKIHSMIAQIASIEITITHTEKEALLLENNLIKEHRPRYNIVLRDDKSYPWIYISTDQEFPRLSFHRGVRNGKGRYFGPYPSASSVRQTLNLLQKLFQIRSCEDSYFSNRTRPCLQHQINRCRAPCVGFVDSEACHEDVQYASLFLQGQNQQVIEALVERMEAASEKLEFESAARYRDQINSLQMIQQKQYMSAGNVNVDVIACEISKGIGCVTLFYIRGGQNLGNKTFFPAHTQDADEEELLMSFLTQYYLADRTDREIPPRILISHPLEEQALIAQVLESECQHKVALQSEMRTERQRWMDLAKQNVSLSLAQRLSSTQNQLKRNDALKEALGMTQPINRIECFDISHTSGELTVASCVVFGPEGAMKSDYRRFNINGITPGDDYAAMHQALLRRFSRLQKEDAVMPDLLLIDGGKGQVSQAHSVLNELDITSVNVVGVAKGPSRKAGLETLVLSDGHDTMNMPADNPALHLIQNVRDEAHRFAITGHRRKREKKRGTSTLEQIEGVGNKRRQTLIKHFGGLQGVSKAGVEDLASVPGISQQLARKIYQALHE